MLKTLAINTWLLLHNRRFHGCLLRFIHRSLQKFKIPIFIHNRTCLILNHRHPTMRSIAIYGIYLAWLAFSTNCVIAAPTPALADVSVKAGCACAHHAEETPLLGSGMESSSSAVVPEAETLIDNTCQADHDHHHHHHHHGPVIPNSSTPNIAKEELVASGSCASGCSHDHQASPVIPDSSTPLVQKVKPTTSTSSCGSGCDHHHETVVRTASPPLIAKEKTSTDSSCGGSCNHHDDAAAHEGQTEGAARKSGGCGHHHGPGWGPNTVEAKLRRKIAKVWREIKKNLKYLCNKLKDVLSRGRKPKTK
ncbi:hypothetical protein PTTG_12723, partial [Puccinia triticina 1-1 BBBD Race 1]